MTGIRFIDVIKAHYAFLFVLILLLPGGCKSVDGQRLSTDESFKVAFLGDQSVNENAAAVLNLVNRENAEMVLHLGDLGYEDNSPAAWEAQINSTLGANFPYFAVIGNHEGKDWLEYQSLLARRLEANPEARCEGDLGVKSVCRYKGLSFILVAPGIYESGHDINDDYAQYIRDELEQDRSLWRICAWHRNQRLMQVGNKKDDVGWEVYEACREGGGIVATAHEHSYSRTYLMTDFEQQKVLTTSKTLTIQEGQTFAFVSGLGGHSIRPQVLDGDWWAAIYSDTQDANYGALFCIFNIGDDPAKAECYFKDINDRIADNFTLYSKVGQ